MNHPQNSGGLPPHWGWMLHIERRVARLEAIVGIKRDPDKRSWHPRDYMLAGAGVFMVIAALAEKVGWTTVVAGLVKLYGVK